MRVPNKKWIHNVNNLLTGLFHPLILETCTVYQYISSVVCSLNCYHYFLITLLLPSKIHTYITYMHIIIITTDATSRINYLVSVHTRQTLSFSQYSNIPREDRRQKSSWYVGLFEKRSSNRSQDSFSSPLFPSVLSPLTLSFQAPVDLQTIANVRSVTSSERAVGSQPVSSRGSTTGPVYALHSRPPLSYTR